MKGIRKKLGKMSLKYLTEMAMFIYFFLISFNMLRLATLNINGINDSMKQLQFIDFVKYHKIDVIFLQEHNIKDRSKINEIDKKFHVFINLSINLKGGTAILIDKRLPIYVINEEKSADSRLISLRIKLYNQIIHLVNTYAHSGKNANLDRENLFDTDLLYILGIIFKIAL